MAKLEKKVSFYIKISWLQLFLALVCVVSSIVRSQWWHLFLSAIYLLVACIILVRMRLLARFLQEHKDDWEETE